MTLECKFNLLIILERIESENEMRNWLSAYLFELNKIETFYHSMSWRLKTEFDDLKLRMLIKRKDEHEFEYEN